MAGLGSILGRHPGGVSDRVRWVGEADTWTGRFHCGKRWTETAGWLGVRVRHSAGLEGELAVKRDPPSWWAGLLLVPGGSCTPGGKVVVFK